MAKGASCGSFPSGDADAIELDWEGRDPEEVHRLYLEEPAWARPGCGASKRRMRHREDRELFWDKGLEELSWWLGLGPPPSGRPRVTRHRSNRTTTTTGRVDARGRSL